MPQKAKIEKLNKLKSELEQYRSFIFTNYRGMNVEQISDLRNKLREKEAQFHVVKNRFVKRIFSEFGYDNNVNNFLLEPTALAYFNSDITEVAKVIFKTVDETSLEVKGGYSEGNIYSVEDLLSISKLPSKEILIAQVVGLMNAPVSGLVFTLSGLLSKFVRTLKAIEDKKQQESN